MLTNRKWFKISAITVNEWMDGPSLRICSLQLTEHLACLKFKQPEQQHKITRKEILISQNTELINLTGDEAFVNLISVNFNGKRTAYPVRLICTLIFIQLLVLYSIHYRSLLLSNIHCLTIIIFYYNLFLDLYHTSALQWGQTKCRNEYSNIWINDFSTYSQNTNALLCMCVVIWAVENLSAIHILLFILPQRNSNL